MNAKLPRIPSYRKQPGNPPRAFVQWDRRRYYFGEWESPESKQRYGRFVAELLAGGGHPQVEKSELTVVELCDRWLTHLESYYAAGSREPAQHRFALKPFLALYGDAKCIDITPVALKAARATMVNQKWCRQHVNRNIGRVKRCFKWGVSEGLIAPNIYDALRTVEPLTFGRGGAKEREPVRPADDADVDATLPHLTSVVTAMVQVQRHCGCRPGELVTMRAVDLNMSGDVWQYRPANHKTKWRGKERVILLGPKCQEIIGPFLTGRAVDAPLFSPAESEAERRAALTAKRKTRKSCGNRVGTNRVKNPKRKPADRYTVQSYNRSIARAARKAGVEPWSANRLRHLFATRVRAESGVDVAAGLLGHAPGSGITGVYAERSLKLAASVALQIG